MFTWLSIRLVCGVFAKPFDSREMNFVFIQNLLWRLLIPGLFCAYNFALSPQCRDPGPIFFQYGRTSQLQVEDT